MEVENIRGVSLDYTDYPGEDLYSEGVGEDILLDIVQNNKSEKFNRMIAENPSWSTLYHLSDLRGNIVDFLQIKSTDKILEVGAGCGAITGTLADKAGSVTCVELSKKRSLINAFRNMNRDNISIRVGNFKDIEKKLPCDYDYIMLIGVFEYAASYIGGKQPYRDFLDILKSHLKEDGRMVIAIENRFGLKYWAGCREDHLGTFYSGIEGYDEDSFVKTFSRRELKKLIADAGMEVKEYYPFPDYKLPVTVFSEERLPKKGELSGFVPNFDNTRVVAFDEEKVFDAIIDEGWFPEYSNSFLFELSFKKNNTSSVIYSRHSNERGSAWTIRTDIIENKQGEKLVVKYPLNRNSKSHVKALVGTKDYLKEQYKDSGFSVNECWLYSDEDSRQKGVAFEYIEGGTLLDRLEDLKGKNQIAEILDITDLFVKRVRSLPVFDFSGRNMIAEDFPVMFGEDYPEGFAALEMGNIDLIFSNIMVRGDEWIVTDYEWMSPGPIPVDYILYRAFKYCKVLDLDFLCERYGISKQTAEMFERFEMAFQKFISRDRLSLIGFYSILGQERYSLPSLVKGASVLGNLRRIRVFYKVLKDYQETYSDYIMAEPTDRDTYTARVVLPKEADGIRLDVTEDPCIVRFIKAPLKSGLTNGTDLGNGVIYFDKSDPMVMFNGLTGGCEYEFEYEVKAMTAEYMSGMNAAMAELIQLREAKKDWDRYYSIRQQLDSRSFIKKVTDKLNSKLFKKPVIELPLEEVREEFNQVDLCLKG